MDDPYNLQRFVDAQSRVYDEVREELRRGEKRSHWMWFIFPQMKGLGRTSTADYYGIASLEEARAYLAHPVLGPRLRECTMLVNTFLGRSADEIFGGLDAMKFRSSMTLFSRAAAEPREFADALRLYFAKEEDPLTLRLLGGSGI